MKNKIFCLGFNKTCTGTLHQTFESIGYKCKHNNWIKWTLGKTNKNKIDEFDFFSDNGDKANYLWLYKTYPNAYFILNSRNLKTWMVSRYNHLKRHSHQTWSSTDRKSMRGWIDERNNHHKNIIDFFGDNILVVDIEKNGEKKSISDINKFCNINITKLLSNHVHSNTKVYKKEVPVINSIIQNNKITDEECDMLYIPRLMK